MSYLITPDRVPILRAQYAAGNPYVGYPIWYNQIWPLNVDPVYAPHNIYLLWAITGEQKWIDLLAEKFHVPPVNRDKNTKRECGVYWISMHTLLAPLWSTERLAVLESELRVYMTDAIKEVYSWDADERISILVQGAMMDEQFGTSYLTANSKNPTSPYYCSMETMPDHLRMQQEAWQHESIDGPTSESAGYGVNTFKSQLYGIACLNDLSKLPGLSEWLPKYREFTLWGISSDYKRAINYGDADNQLDPVWELSLWYRVPMLALLIGIGLDDDGAIADLIAGLCETRAGGKITKPEQLHAILNWGAYLVTDFSLIPLDGPRKPLPSGFKGFRNFGGIYRDAKCYFYAMAQVWLHDDHDYRKGNTLYRLYVNATSEFVVNYMGEYAGNWTAYNAAAIKGQTEFQDRGLDSAEFINGKMIVHAHHRGPMPAYSGSPVPQWYVGHEWLTTIEFTPTNIGTEQPCLYVRYDWKHDGGFPDPAWNPYMPDLREFRPFEAQQFIEGGLILLNETEKQLTWKTPNGQEMLLTYDGSEETKLEPWIYRGYEPFKRFRMFSDRHEGFHELKTTAGVMGKPLPLPPPEPPPVANSNIPSTPAPDDQLPAPTALIIVDNTSIGYHVLGAWIHYPNQGFDNTVDYTEAGDGSRKAVWRAKVVPGVYNVATIWQAMENRAKNALFKISLGNTVLQTVIVNQELSPSSFKDDNGKVWHTLADVTVNSDGILTVELSNAADEFVIADAVRIEKIGNVAVIFPMSFNGGEYKIDRNNEGEIFLQIQKLYRLD